MKRRAFLTGMLALTAFCAGLPARARSRIRIVAKRLRKTDLYGPHDLAG